MKVKQLLVLPNLPERIATLQELAYNLWYSWNWEAVSLFIRLDPELWENCAQNPVEMLSRLPQKTLEKAANDDAFLSRLRRVYEQFTDYRQRKKWFHYKHGDFENKTIGYFSLEYGLDTGLPVYSGGLGVLSGDTLKSASDLGLPMVAVGLLYRYGYFRQFLSGDGWQQERYEENDWYHMPVTPVRDENGAPLKVSVQLDDMPVKVQVWKVMVGLTPLYLLDTNIPDNSSRAREITSVLYGGDKDMRIRQEIILGIGGVRALRAMGIRPDIYHLNEGHSWFLTLERIRELMQEDKLTFREASQFVWSTTAFTTHTPVPAGNEKFDPVLIKRYLGGLIEQLGLKWQEFIAIGRINAEDEAEQFGMTVAALRYAAFCNGVSKLHGQVSRRMWHNIWPNLPINEVPITSITNGVHPASWISHDMKELYESYFGPKYTERPGAPEVWEKVDKIPDAELWRTHNRRRERLIFFARKRLKKQLARRGASYLDIQRADQLLDPNVLTIGFARRFSTYKRGDLFLKDPDRLAAIINNPDRPVQMIIAGKAHPLDNPGKEIIQRIVNTCSEERFRDRIIFIEDYDINVARYMVQGADIWLNNPRRPQEASGTSGMKACLNGALHMSVLDGWWAEGYSEDSGFKIGNGEEFDNTAIQDHFESEALYDVLEREAVPLFYDRNDNDLPERWIARMKRSIYRAGKYFASQRMLMEYTNRFYIPGLKIAEQLRNDNYQLDREVAAWIDQISQSWDAIAIEDVTLQDVSDTVQVGRKIPVQIRLRLGNIRPEDVRVEIVSGQLDSQEELVHFTPAVAELNGDMSAEEGVYTYHGEITAQESGRFGVTARVIPHNDLLVHARQPKLIRWW
ncbi:MAG: glycosyltransferase family 1 protein [Candidatus Zixiibacteriota bacterium]|nr:MAG: glycosyltransferase family 1 protein [candidate division Zixibacteria bacterium]